MSFMSTVLKLAQYYPLVTDVIRAVVPSKSAQEPADNAAVAALTDLRKDVIGRMGELESELVRTKSRLHELETTVNTLQLWVWIGGGALGLLMVILLVLVIFALARH